MLLSLLGLLLLLPGVALAALPDLEADDLEVTQSVQTLTNSVGLIEDKRTYVRLYAHSNGTNVDGVGALLFAVRLAPVNETLGVRSPVNPGGKIKVRTTPQRAQIDESFLFEIPKEWRSGTVRFTGTVDNPSVIAESSEANNSVQVVVDFEAAAPYRWILYNFNYPGGQYPSFGDKLLTYWWLLSGYPTASVSMRQRNLNSVIDWTNDRCTCTDTDGDGDCVEGFCNNDNGYFCTDDSDCGCRRINDILTIFRTIDEYQSPQIFQPAARYYGMVHDKGGFMRGCSPGTTRKVAAGPTGDPAGTNWGWDTDGSYGDWYTAHELGHATGRPHSPCCGASGNAFYPYNQCRISDGEGYGFHTILRQVYHTFWTDVMSYCDDQWISDFTYDELRQQLATDNNLSLPDPDPTPNDLVLATGRVELTTGVAEFRQVLHMQSLQPVPPLSSVGAYSLAFEDAAGGTVHETFFDLVDTYDTTAAMPDSEVVETTQSKPTVSFFVVTSAQPTAARLSLRHLGSEIAGRTVTANAPIVTITAPNGGEVLAPTPTVTWTSSDRDSDPLLATLLYSSDAGVSWTPVATEIDASLGTYVPDLTGLPASTQALFEIKVSDGYHTASDRSDGVFETANNPPFLAIIAPEDGRIQPAQTPLMLEAVADDPEDGELPTTGVEWESDVDGALGAGPDLEVGDLTPGVHLITATATDSGSAMSQQSITVTVVAEVIPTFPVGQPLALALLLATLASAGWLWTRRRCPERDSNPQVGQRPKGF